MRPNDKFLGKKNHKESKISLAELKTIQDSNYLHNLCQKIRLDNEKVKQWC